jgi:FG-GAP-like repeat
VAVADVNGDGKPDLIVTNFGCNTCQHGSVGVLLGNGDGTFQPPLSYDSGALNATSVVVADLNRDSRPDLVVANYYGGNGCFNGSVGVLLNNSVPVDTTPPTITLSSTPKVLWPVDGKMVPVTISGTITDTRKPKQCCLCCAR